jgi:4-amino-4-deoxy-L-arabinose transferase-like glycosyltransferase
VPPLIYAAGAWLVAPTYDVLLKVQALFFGIAGGLMAAISMSIFNRWRVALLTVFMMIGFVPAWPWLCNIFSEPIFTALLAAFVLCWLKLTDHPQSAWRWILMGLLLGVTALTRPVMYFFVPVVMLHAIWQFGLNRQVGLSLVCMLLGFALFEVPWVIRNQMVLGQPIPMTQGTSQAWHLCTFYQAANWTDNVYHDPKRFPPAGEGFWELPKEEQDRRFLEMAKENFRQAPGKVLMLIPKRFLIFFFQLPDTGWFPTFKSLILTGVLYPTAILGFWLAGPVRRKLYQPCLILVLFNAAFYTLLQSEYRYSHPIQPYIMMLSAFGLWGIAERLLAFVRPSKASPDAT